MSKPRRGQRDGQARPSPSKIAEDGFISPDPGNGTTALALLSLKIGLHSYFKTYQSVRCSIAQVIEAATDEDGFDKTMSGRYCEAYAETVVHLQHFLELTLKDVLRRSDAEDMERLGHSRLPEILKEILRLIGARQAKIGKECFELDPAEIEAIKALNKLRNRAWHRGAYSLYYAALDRLGGIFCHSSRGFSATRYSRTSSTIGSSSHWPAVSTPSKKSSMRWPAASRTISRSPRSRRWDGPPTRTPWPAVNSSPPCSTLR